MDLCRREPVDEGRPRPDGYPLQAFADADDDDGRAVRLEAPDGGAVGFEQAGDLVADRGEEVARFGTRGDERRYAPQRRLLLRECSGGGSQSVGRHAWRS
jgi:hypothetical protein